jgi:hypothetical protein
VEAPVKGGRAAGSAGPWRRLARAEHRPLSSLFLGPSWYCRGALPLGDGTQGEANSQLWVVPPENMVSNQYIVLETSPGPSNLNPWIQGLLGTSRTFLGLSYVPWEYIKSWLGRIHHIWKEFESITSLIYVILNCFWILQKYGHT